ncbi:chemotaxis protein CheW [Wansuia hejianensis]|uniref:Chemotaxis protein CheW n=1 Tax=Wansuia hejianensis TaxID=2763667 RepID=A0A926EZ70_9FIRM|nr:chemotaxis protein CheW [Wansuia hejianensis]MBC8590331.1 chemotaxis protein CheW [Wansuia hejianensis]
MQIIVFTLGDKFYALKTDNVEEISKNISPTKVPNAPNWVEGLINLRGNVVTLVNLSKLLQQDTDLCYNNIIIIQNNDEKIGLMVQDVMEVVDIEDSHIEKISENVEDGIIGIIQLNKEIVNIIDIGILLLENEG